MSTILQLRGNFSGTVIGPGDPDYDNARAVFPGGFDRRPAAIVQPADAADVARAIAFARDSGWPLAVRSGGHSGAAHGVCDRGLVIDVRSLKGIDIDAATRTAWAGAGVTAKEYTSAVGEHGLATGFGDTGSVGLSGITLAGGIGFLVRKHGLAIDNLLAAEIVTADGEQRRVDAENHPDLFWAIRGGGGNFGVVTRLKFQLHEVRDFIGGMLMLPATPEVIAGFMAAAEAAPEEVSTIANVMTAPPLPFIPAELHGELILMALMGYAGSDESVLEPFRKLATPLFDALQPMPYAGMFEAPEDDSYHPKAVGENMFIDTFDTGVAETVLKYLRESDASLRVAQLRVLGGAAARVPADATAFAHRASRIMVNLAAFYEGEEDLPVRRQWITSFREALQQQDTGAYVGFLGLEGPGRVRQAYPEATWARLAEVKRLYDPENLFRSNHNVEPASDAGRR